jgi:hypothetical protein
VSRRKTKMWDSSKNDRFRQPFSSLQDASVDTSFTQSLNPFTLNRRCIIEYEFRTLFCVGIEEKILDHIRAVG